MVIDNSSAFRMDPDTPLVVPEVNGADLARHNGVIANPNCTAAILSVAVWPIHQAAGVKRIIVSTYQSASGAGAAAMQELEDQARDFSAGKEIKRAVFPHQIAFNVFSHNTKVAENGYNEEENKVVEETRKMFHLPELPIVPTCIRVPVLRAHAEAITLELERPLSPEEARAILAKAPGVKVVDDPRPTTSRCRSRPAATSTSLSAASAATSPSQRPGDVRGGRPAAEGRRLERRADRRGAGRAHGQAGSDGGGVRSLLGARHSVALMRSVIHKDAPRSGALPAIEFVRSSRSPPI